MVEFLRNRREKKRDIHNSLWLQAIEDEHDSEPRRRHRNRSTDYQTIDDIFKVGKRQATTSTEMLCLIGAIDSLNSEKRFGKDRRDAAVRPPY